MKQEIIKNNKMAAVALVLFLGTASLAYADGGDPGTDPGASADANAGNNNDSNNNQQANTAQEGNAIAATTGAPMPQQAQQAGCISAINNFLMQHCSLMPSGNAPNVGAGPTGAIVGLIFN
jgi:hypothetical protein